MVSGAFMPLRRWEARRATAKAAKKHGRSSEADRAMRFSDGLRLIACCFLANFFTWLGASLLVGADAAVVTTEAAVVGEQSIAGMHAAALSSQGAADTIAGAQLHAAAQAGDAAAIGAALRSGAAVDVRGSWHYSYAARGTTALHW